ncbi:dTDP-glucose 4,6-dehydratase [soil metagenome]
MKILVTGGCGFIGSNFIHHVIGNYPEVAVVNVDLLTYAGNPANVAPVAAAHPDRYAFHRADIADREAIFSILNPEAGFDAVVHFAAESHVDRSIEASDAFVRTNVLGTNVLLDAARAAKVGRFLQVGTDEVYGTLGDEGAFTEETPLDPSSPYSASKAAADMLALANFTTHKLDVVVTRCSNNYGPYQFPEKLVPLMLLNALHDRPLPVYGQGMNVRDWLYVEDHCTAIWAALTKGQAGRVYNIGGADGERPNIEVVKSILAHLGKPESLITYVEDRKGHDWRYAIDSSRARRELGWAPRVAPEEGFRRTIDWYVENEDWWKPLYS